MRIRTVCALKTGEDRKLGLVGPTGTAEGQMLVDTFFARQPIFDRKRRLWGYELLYRSGPVRSAGAFDPVAATAHVMASAFSDTDAVDLAGGVPLFVNLPRQLIVSRGVLAYPPDQLAIEVLEDVRPDAEVIEALAELKALGYRIALDDYVVDDPRKPLLPFVDIVKVDLAAVPQDELAGTVAALRPSGVALLAEKVEGPDMYEICHGLGFSMFQGFFFARPELVAGRRLDEGRARLTGLLADLHRPNIAIDDVAATVERHPDFSLKLLRMLNSAIYGLPRVVESIREAVILLGIRRVTELATVLALASNDQKPRELLSLGLTRARMCATVADKIGRRDPESFFTVGVLSVLDALVDMPMRDLVDPLPLADDIKHALVVHGGPKGAVLDAAIAYERAEWDRLNGFDLDASTLTDSYLTALAWSHRVMAVI